jgi:hypothetical protein
MTNDVSLEYARRVFVAGAPALTECVFSGPLFVHRTSYSLGGL